MDELMAFQHKGFWQCMDTKRDRNNLEEFWNSSASDFSIATGIWNEDKGIDYQISLKDMALDGYSKKQFIALLKIQKGLHNTWEQSKVDASEKSKEILSNLNELK